MSKMYRVGLVGCGRMGVTIDDEVKDRPNSHLFLPYSHAAAIVACERTELAAVCDPLVEKAEEAQKRYAAAGVYTDYREMIRREKLDIVSIATRPGPHAEIAIFAAESGVKGIYCDKPLCNSVREADAMLEACERNGVKFQYGTQRRFAPLYRNLRRMIDAGEIGEVQAVVAHCGAGAAQWGHTHSADMLLFLSGDAEVEFVQGTALAEESDWEGERLKKDVPISMGYVRFKNGIDAYLVAAGGYEFEVGGTQGKLRTLDNGMGYSWRRIDENGRLRKMPAAEAPIESGTPKGFEDLAAALDEDGEALGNIRLACRSQEIIFGLIESHRRGGARVRLPLENRALAIAPDHY